MYSADLMTAILKDDSVKANQQSCRLCEAPSGISERNFRVLVCHQGKIIYKKIEGEFWLLGLYS